MKNCSSRLFACILLLCASSLADEVRLKDGRVLYGKVRTVGQHYEVSTRMGVVRVSRDQLAGDIIADSELRARLGRLAKQSNDSAFAHLQLATQAHRWSLESDMWKHLESTIENLENARQQAVATRLEDFLAQLEPELLAPKWRAASTKVRIDKLLDQHKNDLRIARRAAILALLEREPNAEHELRHQARHNIAPRRRALAVEALFRRNTESNAKFTWRTAILDREAKVRAEAMRIAGEGDNQEAAVAYLAPGLVHNSAEVRIRTAEAYANLGDRVAVGQLVSAGPNAGKALASTNPGRRAHMAVINQQAYIRDFDVEVAQASFIADPQIGVLQSGVVLDVTVHGVYAQRVRILRAYRRALRDLTGSDPGKNVQTWRDWQSELPATPPPTADNRPEKNG
ncbi:MAG: hypothetical protein VYE77_02100 [Planctomycetota bacterium]|nr:hypothetical protein [Planctomycetota bacterium]